jgi:hypothetical protein
MKVNCSPTCGTKAGFTFSLSQEGEFILKKPVEIYHGIYQNIENKVKSPYLIQRPILHANGTVLGHVKSILWSKGTKVRVVKAGVFLEHKKIGSFYAIQDEDNLWKIAEAIS